MGSPPAQLIANGWMSKFDSTLINDAKIYSLYMDDILRNISEKDVTNKLEEINNLHPSLKFTIEEEQENAIPFLDMKISRQDNTLSSTWFTKKTDTGLTMNFHCLAPIKYK